MLHSYPPIYPQVSINRNPSFTILRRKLFQIAAELVSESFLGIFEQALKAKKTKGIPKNDGQYIDSTFDIGVERE
jgi:hypothetical protein